MNIAIVYSLTGMSIFMIGWYGLMRQSHFLRKVLALNLMGTGIFMIFIALANRTANGIPDPVPQAMVLTGIVVAISATAFILAILVRLYALTGRTDVDILESVQEDECACQ